MDVYHIVKDGDLWKLKKEGAGKAAEVAETKEGILKKTQKFMEGKNACVKVHKENGQFQEDRTYQKKEPARKKK